jgi:sirohydrochlorin cobaltochelatase
MALLPAQLLAGASANGKLGVMVCGHGSRNRLAVEEFAQLAIGLQQRLPHLPVAYGYLEFARPILRDGLDQLRQQGVEHVLAVPGMLFAAGHAKNDIPSVLNTYAAESGLRIDYGRELGVDRKMIEAAGARIRGALQQADAAAAAAGAPAVPLHDTLLVVVGRGSSDPDANSNVSKVTRMLVEGFGFGWGETLYSGVTFPLVEPGLRHVVKLGFRRIVVFPYFLFSGVLVSRIRLHSERVAADHPAVEFVQAPYLGDHPLVIDTFHERVEEVVRGDTQMNCSLCKYRAQVLGFEAEVGDPQRSHHHHVEGLIESCTLCERECTGACQPDGVPIPLGSGQGGHSHSHGEAPAEAPGPAHSRAHGTEQAEHAHDDHGHSHSHSHDHPHSQGQAHDHSHSHDPAHDHGHTHTRYPHADHPLGPRSLTAAPPANGDPTVSPPPGTQEIHGA